MQNQPLSLSRTKHSLGRAVHVTTICTGVLILLAVLLFGVRQLQRPEGLPESYDTYKADKAVVRTSKAFQYVFQLQQWTSMGKIFRSLPWKTCSTAGRCLQYLLFVF